MKCYENGADVVEQPLRLDLERWLGTFQRLRSG